MKLQSILLPETEFNNKDKGDALYAMELSLSLEKLNFQKLLQLHKVAADNEDAQLTDYIGARTASALLTSSLGHISIKSLVPAARRTSALLALHQIFLPAIAAHNCCGVKLCSISGQPLCKTRAAL